MTFEEFYAAYPRKKKRLDAERAFKAAIKRFPPESIRLALEAAKVEWQGKGVEFTPYPASWLRATDFSEKAQPSLPKADPRKPDPSIEELLRRGDKPPTWEPMSHDECVKWIQKIKKGEKECD